MLCFLENPNPIGPDSPLSLWFLGGSLVALGTTLAAGFKIVSVIRKELAAYVVQKEYDIHRASDDAARKQERDADERLRKQERESLLQMLTHMHGCMHEVKAAMAALQRRAARKDEEDRRERDDD